MPNDIRALLQSAARAGGTTAEADWRPDLDDFHALDLAKQISAVVSFDLAANTATIAHKASGKTASEPTSGDRASAMRLAIAKLAASLGTLS